MLRVWWRPSNPFAWYQGLSSGLHASRNILHHLSYTASPEVYQCINFDYKMSSKLPPLFFGQISPLDFYPFKTYSLLFRFCDSLRNYSVDNIKNNYPSAGESASFPLSSIANRNDRRSSWFVIYYLSIWALRTSGSLHGHLKSSINIPQILEKHKSVFSVSRI